MKNKIIKEIKYRIYWLKHDSKRFVVDTLPMKFAFILPKKIQLWCFIAVSGCKGDCPEPFYSEYYKAFIEQNNIKTM